ncbi:adenosine deaminase [Legionella steigerwaltii]|uniref:Adenosine deaminase n=1 Tax=Legionella steigerwaltii TaxID=460 RepID=A0A378L9P0_9GAMM|nr:amidohydrolase family protein [Legionella steigerwaltii]KTD77730.1 adenosine deaminase [Legionella steigerwaltii]STY23040.1 adenosine deaminase [Legionella steigerwaltii]
MFEKNKSDLHCHLNGSFSLEFLEKTSEDNDCRAVYYEYKELRARYLEATQEQPMEGYSKKLIDMIWGLFGLIHKMVQTLDDITQGTIDVAKNSEAKYLEIRTTPKEMKGKSRNDYIDAFEAGLRAVSVKDTKKIARGLLSLDRTQHTVDDAETFIQRVLNSPNKVLVGIDISGNPLGKRTLTGNDLGKAVRMALEHNVSIAIHMGESDTEIEKQDTDAVLDALEKWQKEHPDSGKALFLGKIRLGHCIYLTEQQKERIRALALPIEVCPTCHKKLNWHLEEKEHPVASVYSDVSENLVIGTDDDAIFGGRMHNEFKQFMRFFTNKKNLSNKEIKEHQAAFRFGS